MDLTKSEEKQFNSCLDKLIKLMQEHFSNFNEVTNFPKILPNQLIEKHTSEKERKFMLSKNILIRHNNFYVITEVAMNIIKNKIK